MKKLLELKSLDTEVRELLHTVETPPGVYICVHLHYLNPNISIYNSKNTKEDKKTQLLHNNVLFEVDIKIDEQIVDELIAQIERVMQ